VSVDTFGEEALIAESQAQRKRSYVGTDGVLIGSTKQDLREAMNEPCGNGCATTSARDIIAREAAGSTYGCPSEHQKLSIDARIPEHHAVFIRLKDCRALDRNIPLVAYGDTGTGQLRRGTDIRVESGFDEYVLKAASRTVAQR